MKRLIVALMVGGVLFATVFGVAAALKVDAGVLQAGSDKVLECDTDCTGVQVYFRSGEGPGIDWDEDANDFIVTAVVVGGVNDACDGSRLEVELTDEDGDGLANGEVTISLPGDDPVVELDKDVPASEVYDVHVLIQD
jgi:hypothetical protein